MGWLFGYNSRKSLTDHLLHGNGVTTIRHCFKGNNLWAIQEGKKQDGTTVKFIALYLLRGNKNSRDGWGYKDLDETAGPNYYNCPLAYLDEVEDPGYYATDWRKQVRQYWMDRNLKLNIGQRIKIYGREYVITESLGRRGYMLNDMYRLRIGQLPDVEVIDN